MISLYGSYKVSSGDLTKCCQIDVEHDVVATDPQNRPLYLSR